MSCGSRPSPADAFTGSAGLYWEKTEDKNSGSTYYMPGLRTNGAAFQYYNYYYGTTPRLHSLPPGAVVRVYDALRLPADHRVRQYQLRPHGQAQRRSGRRALPLRFHLLQPLRPVRLRRPTSPSLTGLLAQVEQQVRHQLQDHRQGDGVRRLRAGLPRRRLQRRRCAAVLRQRRAAATTHPTRSTTTRSAGKRRTSTVA